MEKEQNEGIVFVTGANARYFPILLTFLDSFDEFCRGERLYVCDFGLSSEQRAFLSELGLLLERPQDMAEGLRSFYYKASIGRYLENVDFDTVVWVDSDCLVAGSLGKHVHALADRLRLADKYLAVCPDYSGTIGEFIDRHKEDQDGTGPFDALVKDWGISRNLPYLNSAVFLLRSEDFLKEWHRWAFEIPYHVLFEQNVFNSLAYGGLVDLHLMDTNVWNLHDLELDRLQVCHENGKLSVTIDGKQALVVHATSFMQKAIAVQDISLEVDGMKMRGFYKFIRNPEMQREQMNRLVRYIKKHQGALVSCGVIGRWEPPSPEASHMATTEPGASP